MTAALWWVALGAFVYEVHCWLKVAQYKRMDRELQLICELGTRP